MNWDVVRSLGLIGLFSWGLAIPFVFYIADGQPLDVRHRKTLGAGFLLVSIWAFTLLITMRSTGLLSRASTLPFSATLLFSGVFLLWTWLVLSARLSFTIRRAPRKRRNLSTFAGD